MVMTRTSNIFFQNKFQKLGEGTLCPPQIVVTNTKILHLVFVSTCEHHILFIFAHFKYLH